MAGGSFQEFIEMVENIGFFPRSFIDRHLVTKIRDFLENNYTYLENRFNSEMLSEEDIDFLSEILKITIHEKRDYTPESKLITKKKSSGKIHFYEGGTSVIAEVWYSMERIPYFLLIRKGQKVVYKESSEKSHIQFSNPVIYVFDPRVRFLTKGVGVDSFLDEAEITLTNEKDPGNSIKYFLSRGSSRFYRNIDVEIDGVLHSVEVICYIPEEDGKKRFSIGGFSLQLPGMSVRINRDNYKNSYEISWESEGLLFSGVLESSSGDVRLLKSLSVCRANSNFCIYLERKFVNSFYCMLAFKDSQIVLLTRIFIREGGGSRKGKYYWVNVKLKNYAFFKISSEKKGLGDGSERFYSSVIEAKEIWDSLRDKAGNETHEIIFDKVDHDENLPKVVLKKSKHRSKTNKFTYSLYINQEEMNKLISNFLGVNV